MTMPIRALQRVVVTMPDPTGTMVNGQPVDWTPTSVSRAAAGFFVLAMAPEGMAMTDVTYFRGVPTQLNSYTYIDPFTYGTAVITFPQITGFDNLDTVGGGFLGTEDNPANVDIYWYPAAAGTDFINPMTGARDLTYAGTPVKLWEGFIASRDMVGDEKSAHLQVQCQGALFQLDGYKQKPFYPRRPYVLERLMFEIMYPYYEPGNQGHPWAKPNLRTLPLTTRWPATWSKITPERTADEPNLFTPVIPPDRMWTGYTTRNTGTWDNCLSGFVQDMLSIMYTTDDCGVPAGDQWTLRCEENRSPVLEIREKARTPDFEVWYGTPGVSVTVSNDLTQKENALYGEGSGTDGTLWRNSYFTGAWNRTDYEPLAAREEVYPAIPDGEEGATGNFEPNFMVRESKTQYPSGVTLLGGITSAEKRLATVKDAGWSGTLTLRVDPSASLTRWQIRAGMSVLIKGLKGSGATGIKFHIAEVVVDVDTLTVECKIDTKYRDLLTLEEARARNIDPMTPSKLLQVNKRSLTVEDILAPWDYHSGSGYIPKTARYGKNKKEGINAPYNFFDGMPLTTKFPWQSWTRAHPPSSFPVPTGNGDAQYLRGPYVRCDADNSLTKLKWCVVPVITAQKFTARKIEVAAYDVDGNVLEIPFHLSLYDRYIADIDMPHTGSDFSPFTAGHFESITSSGNPTPDMVPEGLILGWGNSEQYAGHSPGLSSEGYPATGKLIDEGTWTHDNAQNPDFDITSTDAQRPEAITIWAAFWADHTENVFFLGRIYKAEQAGV